MDCWNWKFCRLTDTFLLASCIPRRYPCDRSDTFSYASWIPRCNTVDVFICDVITMSLTYLLKTLKFSYPNVIFSSLIFFSFSSSSFQPLLSFFSSEFIFSSPHFHIDLLQGILFNWHYLISCLLIWLLFYFLFKSQEFNQDSRNLFNLIKTQETSSRYFGYFIYIFF